MQRPCNKVEHLQPKYFISGYILHQTFVHDNAYEQIYYNFTLEVFTGKICVAKV